MFLQGISTVGDVLDALSRDLDIQRQFLSIVDTTTGQILNEEDLIKHLNIKCIELMIGNENRNNGFSGKDGGNVETDVIDNKQKANWWKMSNELRSFYRLLFVESYFQKCKRSYNALKLAKCY